MRRRTFRQSLPQHQRNPALADVGARRLQSFAFVYDLDRHFNWLAEVSASLLDHEIQRGMKAAGRVELTDRFLQNEIGAHPESFMGGRPLAIEDGERNRVSVAGSAS